MKGCGCFLLIVGICIVAGVAAGGSAMMIAARLLLTIVAWLMAVFIGWGWPTWMANVMGLTTIGLALAQNRYTWLTKYLILFLLCVVAFDWALHRYGWARHVRMS